MFTNDYEPNSINGEGIVDVKHVCLANLCMCY